MNPSRFRPTRRSVLAALAASAALAPLSRRARAATVSGADLKFLFVYSTGGWDVTRVFAPSFGNDNVDMESEATTATLGDIRFVDHPDRPSVRTFFESWYDRATIINGVRGRSLAHEVCRQVSLTGTTSGSSPDWPSLLAEDQASAFLLPNLVLSGPSFPAGLSPYAARAGNKGQMEDLITGNIMTHSDTIVLEPTPPADATLEAEVIRRAQARAALARPGRDADLMDIYARTLQRASDLKANQGALDLGSNNSPDTQSDLAVAALSLGYSRVVTMDFPNNVFPYSIYTWDSHVDNDTNQSYLWEALFDSLVYLMQRLSETPGTVSASLADETVVVVMSEMGRTPRLNTNGGKDHWPHNSTLLLAPHVAGRVIGGYDADFLGDTVDLASGEVSASGSMLVDGSLGATLLAMADIDPAELVDTAPISALLS